ncbi:MAG: membrane dipeptidase [Chloroflexota bacterium]|nr:membrane dipeptidase [Chloroflexota bacterium]MDE2839099.1 membrane dipeptidase [Chloroflexota bacterium]
MTFESKDSQHAAGLNPLARALDIRVRQATLERIRAGHQVMLAELKPTRAQIDRGLELHYNSFVADVQGSVQLSSTHGLVGDRLRQDLEPIRKELSGRDLDPVELQRRLHASHFKRKTFESAFDEQWIAESQALYHIAGVDLGVCDVAGPEENTFETALDRISRINFAHDQRDDIIRVAKLADIERGIRSGTPCEMFHLAGVGCFAETDDPLRNLDLFYALGVRMSQMTYIQDNGLCSSYLQERDTGLTPLGHQVVRRMNELGIMVDLAHSGEQSSYDMIAASTEPVLLSHTGCRAVYDDSTNRGYLEKVFQQPYARGATMPARPVSRNADDAMLKAVAAKGGLVAIYSIDYVLGTGPESFHTWYRHLEHAISVAGSDHVAIGTDRTFFPTWPPGALDWTNWPYWTVGLVCKGHSDEEIQKIIGTNFLRYARQVLDKRPWGAFM